MDIIKRRILLEDFINRQKCFFVDIDGTNSYKDKKKKNIWGKIPMDIVVSNKFDLNDICYIGFQLIECDENLLIDKDNIEEWDENLYKYENVGNIYKTIDDNQNVTYKQLLYNNILSLTFNKKRKNEYIFAVKYSDVEKKDIDDDYLTILRFNTLVKWYRFLEEFRYGVVFYKRCGNRWVEVDSDEYEKCFKYITDESDKNGEYDKITYYPSLNIAEGDNIIGISSLADVFNNTFRLNNKHKYEKKLWELAEKVLKGEYYNFSLPFIDIPLYIDSNIESVGLYETQVNMWNENKTYLLDERVIYEDNLTYKLVKGNDMLYTEVDSGLYLEIRNNSTKWKIMDETTWKNNISDGPWDVNCLYEEDNTDKHRIVILKNDGCLYLPTFSYKGKFNTNYWCKIEEVATHEINIESEKVSCEIESKLQSIRRRKKSVDEDGNVLPFVITEDGEGIKSELVYRLGVSNTYVTGQDNMIYVDILDEIIDELTLENVEINENWQLTAVKHVYKFISDNTNNGKYKKETHRTQSKYDVDNNGQLIEETDTVTENSDKEMPINIGGDTGDESSMSRIGKITFKYRIGVRATMNNGEITFEEGSGIEYIETYDYENVIGYYNYHPLLEVNKEKNIGWTEVTGDTWDISNTIEMAEDLNKYAIIDNFGQVWKAKNTNKLYRLLRKIQYVDIDYSSKKVTFNTRGMSAQTLMSNATYGGELINDDKFISENIVKPEYLMGVEDWVDDVDIEIERGTSAAFERHNILTEVNTMEDLVNYRNNFFKL